MNKYNLLEEEIEKTEMSYIMQLANEKLEYEKNIADQTKLYRIKINEITSIGFKNNQNLKRNNELIKQDNNEITKKKKKINTIEVIKYHWHTKTNQLQSNT
jgi:hypothetical protein